jgi:hypothetical protein
MNQAIRRSAILATILPLANTGLADTTFQFLRAEFHQITTNQLPAGITQNGITLLAQAANGPVDFVDYLNPRVEPALFINSSDGIGMGIDSPSITNSRFVELFGNDLNSESIVFNFLQSVTVSFDHTVFITELAFGDLEQHEVFIIETADGLRTEIRGSTPWSVGNSGTSTWSGSALGALHGHRIERGSRITFTFDTVNPLDRVPDGTGNNLNASPSAGIRWIKVATPADFGMGMPFVVQGGAHSATVGVELWGADAQITLYWSDNPATGWSGQAALGARSPLQILDAVIDGLTPNTTWYFMFEADSGSQLVQSPVASFAWATDLYVSPAGDDNNDGLSVATPLATIDAAVRRIATMARRPQPEGPLVPNFYGSAQSPHGGEIAAHLSNLVDPVTVHLMPGYHYLLDTVVIDKSIDGNIHFRGLWADGAAELLRDRLAIHGDDPRWMDPPASHMPVVSGGQAIADWQQTTVNGVTAWVTALPDVAAGGWTFDQLFVNGRRAERSRWPKQGWFRMQEVNNTTRLNFRVSERDARDIDIVNFTNFNDVQVVALHRWVETRMRLGAYNPATRWMDLLPPAPDPVFTLDGSHPVHGAGFAAYYFDNVFETLSEPGEWYLDRSTGQLYYIPLPGEQMHDTHVVAPRLHELFRVVGREAGTAQINERLWHVSFRHIAFMHTRVGELALHTGTGNNPYSSGRGALHFRYARAPIVEACLFGHVGEFGVEFAMETIGGVVGANLFRSMAFGAFKMWQSNQAAGLQDRTGWGHIHDNDVMGYGLYWHGGVGLLIGESVFTAVEHNHVRDGFYSTIRVAGGNTIPRYGFANVVRKNRAHDAGKGVLSDLAGLYVPGKSPHSIVEGNVVYNINARDYQSQTVYLDGQAEHWTVRNNWLYGTNERSITIKGWTHDIYNNVVAFNTGDGLIDRRNGDELSANSQIFPLLPRRAPVIERNIFFQAGNGYTYHSAFYNDVIQPWAVIDHNLHWNQTGAVWMNVSGAGLAAWSAAEAKDQNARVADPLLFNPQRGDFRVPTNSPAVTQLGFIPFDNRDAGIRPSVWQVAGAVTYTVTAPPLPDWLPSDVPGLDGWLDAADLTRGGPLPEWPSKTPFTYTMRQFDTDLQPTVQTNARNGLPVVRFNGSAWMGNHEHAWRTRQHAGRFFDREFTIFSVHRSSGDNNVVLAKGNTASGGQWTIGRQANALEWDGNRTLGSASDEFAVHAWRRGPQSWQFYRNGQRVSEHSDGINHNFDSDAILYLGRSGNGGLLNGEVGEILIYMGHVTDADMDTIHAYLIQKWLEPTGYEAEIFTSAIIEENRAAYQNAYLRSLTVHLDPTLDIRGLSFAKVSGPQWLIVDPDGMLRGTPAAADSGPNSFEVQATTADGGQHTVVLQIPVGPPNPQPAQAPAQVRIDASLDEGIQIQWQASPDPDFSHYAILRSHDLENFETFAQPVWVNTFSTPWDGQDYWFFIIQAVNTSGN